MASRLKSKKRRLPAPSRDNDVRTEWERDLARLLHSAAFRRLQSKAQIFGLGESDFNRTRLTHSLEVAQIGAGLLKFLKINFPEFQNSMPDSQLMNVICLAQNVGHAPFGYGGEVALNYCMRNYGGFECNAQTLRVISRLEKYTEGFGLNLTRRMMLGVLKYPVAYSQIVNPELYSDENSGASSRHCWIIQSGKQRIPKCYYDEEQEVVDFIFKHISRQDRNLFQQKAEVAGRHNKPTNQALDTSIMEIADTISYTFHDLEDAISLGIITKDSWLAHFEQFEHLFFNCIKFGFNKPKEKLCKELFADSYKRKMCVGELINFMVTNVELYESLPDAECSLLKYNARLKFDVEALRMKIYELVKKEVILHESIQQLELKGQKLVVELFDILASDPERFLAKETRQLYQRASTEQLKMRVIADYISGMTDEYATRFYEKIFFPRQGSVFARL